MLEAEVEAKRLRKVVTAKTEIENNLKKTIEEKYDEIRRMEAELKYCENELDKIKKDREAKDAELSEKKQELNQAKSNHATLKADYASVNNHLKQVEEENCNLKQEIIKLTDSVTELTNNSHLYRDLLFEDNEIDKAYEALKKLKVKNNELKIEILGQIEKNVTLCDDVERSSVKIKDLELKCGALEADARRWVDCQKEMAEYQEMKVKFVTTNKQLSEELEQCQSKSNNNEYQLNCLKMTHAYYQAETARLEQENKNLLISISDLKQQLSNNDK